jgi:hypothetical protein
VDIQEVQRPQRYFSSSAEYPFEKITEEITDGDETLDPPGECTNMALRIHTVSCTGILVHPNLEMWKGD